MAIDREYAVTLTGREPDWDTYETALDRLPDACLLGGPGFDTCALVFSVVAISPALALAEGAAMLAALGVEVPDGASLSTLEHEAESAA